jgi:hypothetical protein
VVRWCGLNDEAPSGFGALLISPTDLRIAGGGKLMGNENVFWIVGVRLFLDLTEISFHRVVEDLFWEEFRHIEQVRL